MDLYSIKRESFEYLNSSRTLNKDEEGLHQNYCNIVVNLETNLSDPDKLLEVLIFTYSLPAMFRNNPGISGKQLGTVLSVLGSKLTTQNKYTIATELSYSTLTIAIIVLGEAMLMIENIPVSEEKDMLVRENYRALGTSFYNMGEDIFAIYYFTMYLSFGHLVEERQFVVVVNDCLSDSYFRIGQLEQSIKYSQDVITTDKGINNSCLFTLGNAFMELEDFPNAYKYHADAFKIRKSDPKFIQKYLHWSYGCVARCQMNMKYYSLAIKNYNKAINLIETNMSEERFLRKYMDDCSHCYAMLGQFQGARDVYGKSIDTFVKPYWSQLDFCNSNEEHIAYACNIINLVLLNYKIKKQKGPILFTFFDLWMSNKSPIFFIALCLRKLFPEDLPLFKKLINQLLDKKRRNPQVVAKEIRPHFREVFNSVMISKHISSSILSLRRSLMN
jgi:tetratricopeptide (TPR) repeat protein